jgi:hypothetical protein
MDSNLKLVKPKLITLSGQTVRNQKTLIWLQNQTATINWSKWDAVVTSLDAYKYWSSHNTNIVGIVITEISCLDRELDGQNVFSDVEEFLTDLFNVAKNVPIIFLTQDILQLKSEEFWADNFDNVMNINMLFDNYPFMERPWDGTLSGAIIMFALLNRYNRLVDSTVFSKNYKQLTFEQNTIPEEVYLIGQYFVHSSEERARELRKCLKRNSECDSIDKIILLNETDLSKEWFSSKITQHVIGKRLTYADFIEYVMNHVPSNVFVILANADIYFDSMDDLWRINMTDRMLALLRWDDLGTTTEPKISGPRADSQDTWIFRSDSIHNKSWDLTKFNFQLGRAGCDNAFAAHVFRHKFVITNPSLTFKSYHLHNTNIRNYDPKDFIRSDLYLNLVPTLVIDTQQVKEPDTKLPQLTNTKIAFDIKSTSLSNEITFCTMVNYDGRFAWEPSTKNYYEDTNIPVYHWKNVAMTWNSLVYTHFSIYVGAHVDNDKYQYWRYANVDIYTPMKKVNKLLAIPFGDPKMFQDGDRYILEYLSRCFRLLTLYPDFSFLLPNNLRGHVSKYFPALKNAIVIDENEAVAYYANEVVGFLPAPVELGKEDIQALRAQFLLTDTLQKENVSVFVNDVLSEEFIRTEIAPLYNNSKVVCVDRSTPYTELIDTKICIIYRKSTDTTWTRLWALPEGCHLIELVQELEINGELAHLAHVAGLKTTVSLLSKGKVEDVRSQIIDELNFIIAV